MADTLREYLVKIGWSVDDLGMNAAQNKLKGFSNKIESMGSGIAGSFAKAGASVLSFIGTSVFAMVGLLDTTAQADLSVERFARKMWTTEENARSFLTALDAMNAEYKDIFYMTPEEYRNLMDLKSLGSSLTAPAGLQEGLKLVRDIRHEFNRTKTIIAYASQWVSYYLTKYLGKDLNNTLTGFKGLNDFIMKNIPQITEKVAQFFIIILKLGSASVRLFSNLGKALSNFFSSLSTDAKIAGGAIVGFVALLKMGPIGMFIAAILAILLLLDDFYTWKAGGKSALSETWEQLDKFGEDNKFSKKLEDMGTSFAGLLDSVGKLGGTLLGLAGDFGEFVLQSGIVEIFLTRVSEVLNEIKTAVIFINDVILVLMGKFDELSEHSVFKKLLAITPDGKIDVFGTAGNAGGMAIKGFGSFANNITGSADSAIEYNKIMGRGGKEFSGIDRTSDKLLNYLEGHSVAATSTASTYIPYSYGGGQAAGAGVGRGGSGDTTSTVTQVNNINVVAAPGESAQTTATRTASEILKQRSMLGIIR